ncbi:hypothetical protein HK100_003358 [Physocladia obscura]|uniref:Thioredoxin domain-containing protein n=1 Tax=Physocladia obscura TaxID=109957 RepID=A0AAD5SV16_9FUNG|nr:hypothetical protein HK100_003358 [Physocladia obscura]
MLRFATRKFTTTTAVKSSTPTAWALGSIVERGDSDFKKTIAEAGTTPVLVDFYADWCGPCRMLAPILKKVVSIESPKTFLIKVNTDEAVETASEFGVSALPTVGIFKSGKLVDQFVGLRDEKFVKEFIERNL